MSFLQNYQECQDAMPCHAMPCRAASGTAGARCSVVGWCTQVYTYICTYMYMYTHCTHTPPTTSQTSRWTHRGPILVHFLTHFWRPSRRRRPSFGKKASKSGPLSDHFWTPYLRYPIMGPLLGPFLGPLLRGVPLRHGRLLLKTCSESGPFLDPFWTHF